MRDKLGAGKSRVNKKSLRLHQPETDEQWSGKVEDESANLALDIQSMSASTIEGGNVGSRVPVITIFYTIPYVLVKIQSSICMSPAAAGGRSSWVSLCEIMERSMERTAYG